MNFNGVIINKKLFHYILREGTLGEMCHSGSVVTTRVMVLGLTLTKDTQAVGMEGGATVPV